MKRPIIYLILFLIPFGIFLGILSGKLIIPSEEYKKAVNYKEMVLSDLNGMKRNRTMYLGSLIIDGLDKLDNRAEYEKLKCYKVYMDNRDASTPACPKNEVIVTMTKDEYLEHIRIPFLQTVSELKLSEGPLEQSIFSYYSYEWTVEDQQNKYTSSLNEINNNNDWAQNLRHWVLVWLNSNFNTNYDYSSLSVFNK